MEYFLFNECWLIFPTIMYMTIGESSQDQLLDGDESSCFAYERQGCGLIDTKEILLGRINAKEIPMP